ncbi:MAG: hypothetical protein M1358_18000 [Chloroflexi bacterium]|nr:hypothetical protein [Chloroflexota bacterium]
MDRWDNTDEAKEGLIDRLKSSNGKDFLKSIDHLKRIAPELGQEDLDKMADTVSKRLWLERHPLIMRGSVAALGILTAGVTARVTLEAIARSPEKYPNWIWTPAAEAMLRLGWRSNFTKHFLGSISNQEVPLQKRLSIVESVSTFSALGRQLARDASMVEEAMAKVEPPIRDALTALLTWTRK